MPRRNCFVKLSGDLFNKDDVHEWLRALSQKYHIVISVGGGTQINEAFEKAGIPIGQYGPLGRETKTLAERQLSRNTLEQNQTALEDILDEKGITATVEIPWVRRGTVECPVNGDTDVLMSYFGFCVLYVVTTNERVSVKEHQFAPYPKVQIKGFSR